MRRVTTGVEIFAKSFTQTSLDTGGHVGPNAFTAPNNVRALVRLDFILVGWILVSKILVHTI